MNKFNRKNIRLVEYNYSEPGYYFITICTNDKKNFFGNIEKNQINYSNIGMLAINNIEKIKNIYKNISVDKYVVMPNHIHMILIIRSGQDVTLGRIIKQYKESVTKSINESIWQRSYFDRIIRNEKEYHKIWKYIDENVLKWQLDVYHKE